MTARVDIPSPVGALLKRAMTHTSAKRGAEAVECLAAACVLDVQQYQQRFLAHAQAACVAADLYRDALALLGARGAPLAAGARHAGPLRVAYVLFQVREGQAATRRVLNLCRQHRRDRVQPVVIVTEDLCRRTPATTTLVLPDAPSAMSAPEIMRAFAEAGVPVHVISTAGTHVEGGRAAADLMRALGVDVAVYLGGPTTAVQTACAAWRGAPVQVNLNIGVPMLSPGIDAVIYTHPLRAAADAEVVRARGVRVMGLACSGCDARGAADAPEADRGAIGLPTRGDGAVVLVTASNKLDIRLREAEGVFARDLAAFLRTHPRAWWVGVGRGDVHGALGALREGPGGDELMRRIVLTGGLADIRPVLKACDIYLNEYPEGGYNTVVESMAAGTPVVALAASGRHGDCAGALLVGEPDGVMTFDRAAYWSRAAHWACDADARREAGTRQQARALAQFDYSAVCGWYEDTFVALDAAQRKAHGAPATATARG